MESFGEQRRQRGIVDEACLYDSAEHHFDPEKFVDEQFKDLGLEELQNYLYQTLQF